MAARLNKHHSDAVRAKIQSGVIIDRLHKHQMGVLELTSSQIKAAEILLDRSVAKLQQIQHSGEDGGPIKVQFSL
jgi:hypothetical protein